MGSLKYDTAGRLVMAGNPRFGLGVYDSGIGYFNDATSWESALFKSGRLLDLPINLYLNYHYGEAPITAMTSMMDVLAPRGIRYFQTCNCSENRSYLAIKFAADQSAGYRSTFSAHAGAAGYYTMDECADVLIAETRDHHTILKAGGVFQPPDVLTFGVCIARGYRDPRLWTGAFDILGTDPYPLYGTTARAYTHFQVADYVADAVMANPGRPTIAVLQLFKATSDSRLPTAAEMRAHAVMAIVSGARGIFWWEIGMNGLRKETAAVVDATMWDLRVLVTELRGLDAALMASDANTRLKNSTTYASPLDGRKAEVARNIAAEWLESNKDWWRAELARLNAGDTTRSPMMQWPATIKTRTKFVNGVGYVFAYNYTNTTQAVTFTWDGSLATVKDVGAGLTFAVSGASWGDTFGPYVARIYTVQPTPTTPPPGTTVTILDATGKQAVMALPLTIKP